MNSIVWMHEMFGPESGAAIPEARFDLRSLHSVARSARLTRDCRHMTTKTETTLSWSPRATVRLFVIRGHARGKKMMRLPLGADELRRRPQTGKSRAINIMAFSSVDDSLQVSRNSNAVVTCCGSFCFQESGHNCGTAGSRHAGLLDRGSR